MKEQHFAMLGRKAEDRVTGFKGIITSLSFDLYGCIQVVLTPPADRKDGIVDGHWFDVNRIEIKNEKPIMPVPDFDSGHVADGLKGASIKPLP